MIFDKQITSYTIMAIIGVLVSGVIASHLISKETKNDNDMINLLLISSVGVLLGGHILYGLTNIQLIIITFRNLHMIKTFADFIDVIINIFGGSVFYGGLLGGLLFGYGYLKKKKLNIKLYSDICAIIIPLFHFFGRIGCFLVGCCYGIESKLGIMYTHSLVESANHVRRLPIQLIEAGFNFTLFLFLYYLYTKNKGNGKLLRLYLGIYAVGRFVFEFFRGDDYRGFLLGLSTSQVISALIILYLLITLVKKTFSKSNN